jgi:predicted nucleic acid-binding protein
MILLDSNVLLDLWGADPIWQPWSSGQIRRFSITDELAINVILYAEISVRFSSPAILDQTLNELGVTVLPIPRAAAFLAGKAHLDYRRKGGTKGNVLPDFFVGAHAAVLGCPLLTRDIRRYVTYFPTVPLIAP